VSSERSRAFLPAFLLLLLAVGGFRLFTLVIFTVDRQELATRYSESFDKDAAEYPRFLSDVARWTKAGDRIAIFVPARTWDDGYAYAYYRAHYFLTGREVLPLVWRDDRLLRENFAAEYIAVWRMNFRPAGYRVVSSSHEGMLLQKVAP
jgi:hypothetical protein